MRKIGDASHRRRRPKPVDDSRPECRLGQSKRPAEDDPLRRLYDRVGDFRIGDDHIGRRGFELDDH